MEQKKMDEAFELLFSPMIEKIVKRVLSDRKGNLPKDREPEQFLTIGQAAKEFGCTNHLLQKAINNLELEHSKTDNRTYIRRKHVKHYLDSLRIKSREDNEGYDFLK